MFSRNLRSSQFLPLFGGRRICTSRSMTFKQSSQVDGNLKYKSEKAWKVRNLVMKTGVGRYRQKPDGLEVSVSYIDTAAGDLNSPSHQHKNTILAVHGCPGTHNDVIPVVKPVWERGPEKTRVLIPNFPGYDETSFTSFADTQLFKHTTSDYVCFLQDFLTTVKAETVEVMAGHSVGTVPLLVLAYQHHPSVRGMVLVCPVAIGMLGPLAQSRVAIANFIMRYFKGSRDRIASTFVRLVGSSPDFMPIRYAFVAMQLVEGIERPLFSKALKDIADRKLPIMYVCTTRDNMVDYNKSLKHAEFLGLSVKSAKYYELGYKHLDDELFEESLGSELVIFEGKFHYPQLTPLWYPTLNRLVVKFYDKVMRFAPIT